MTLQAVRVDRTYLKFPFTGPLVTIQILHERIQTGILAVEFLHGDEVQDIYIYTYPSTVRFRCHKAMGVPRIEGHII